MTNLNRQLIIESLTGLAARHRMLAGLGAMAKDEKEECRHRGAAAALDAIRGLIETGSFDEQEDAPNMTYTPT